MVKIIRMASMALMGLMASTTLLAQTMTDFGTPRNETVVFQTFDGTTSKAGNYNTLMGSYNIWGG